MATGLRERWRINAMRTIQERALDLFDARGFDAVTIEEIAAAAEVSPSSVYRYFGTKEGLVVADEFDSWSQEAVEEILDVNDPVGSLLQVVLNYEAAPGQAPLDTPPGPQAAAGLLGAEPGVALVAVGGYGRKELLPGSDLDVLLLHDGREGIAKIADRIWYPVWDSGARLDHAVRTVPQARRVARNDLKVALGLLNARHVAGDLDLTTRLREGALEDWRGNARTRLAELKELHEERTRMHGELAFLLEPDLKESRGGQRDVHAIQAIAAAWVAPAPGPRVRAAYEQILDARHVLHEVTGRHMDRLVLEEQDEVARTLGLLDGDALLRQLAGAGRTVAYAVDHAFRQAGKGLWPAWSACGCAAQAGAPPARGRGGRAGRRGGCWRGPLCRPAILCSCCAPPPRGRC